MSAKVTSAQLVIKQLQYIEEVTEGTTPSSSPTFNECGKIQSLSFTRDNSEIEVGQIGPEDLYNLLQGKTVSGFKVKMAIFSSTFLKYCINAANYGTPAGTISTPLSFVSHTISTAWKILFSFVALAASTGRWKATYPL